VEGNSEKPGQRSGDYKLTHNDGRTTEADLYQPESGNSRNIESNIIKKSGQAETIVVELSKGESRNIGAAEAQRMADNVINTPGHGVNRIIIFKDNIIIGSASRPR